MCIQIRVGNYGLQAVCTACERHGVDISHIDLPHPISVRPDECGISLATYPVGLATFLHDHEGH